MLARAYLTITEPILPMVCEAVGGEAAEDASKRIREDIVYSIWQRQPWGAFPIRDVKGKLIEILSPGWRGAGPGPDFRDALFRYDGGPVTKGDAEAHVRSSDWLRHGHHRDPAYDDTRLHVVLYCDSAKDPRMTSAGGALIEIELGPLCAPIIDNIRSETELDPSQADLSLVTGRCGKELTHLGPDGAAKLLDAAGEARLELKSRRYERELAAGKGEDVLYQGLLEALGYRVYKRQFASLAHCVPLSLLRPIMVDIGRTQRAAVLQGILLGAAGLTPDTLEIENLNDPESTAYLLRLKEVWDRYKDRFDPSSILEPERWPLKGTRPANYPMGRIAGLAHFLAAHLDSDLEILFERIIGAFPADGGPRERKEWKERIATMFATPEGDYWAWRYVAGGKKQTRARRLISGDRVALFLINVALPFFLARAKTRKNKTAEDALVRMYHKQPATAGNSIVTFMVERLFEKGRAPAGFMNAVRQQGLIQVYNDFCMVNATGCEQCRFVSRMQSFAEVSNQR